MFNEFLMEFKCMENTGVALDQLYVDALDEIVDTILLIRPRKLLHSEIRDHSLLHFLCQILLVQQDKWRISCSQLNIQEMDIFLKIILIFVHAAEQASNGKTYAEIQRRTHLMTTKRFLYIVRDQIDQIVLHNEAQHDPPDIHTIGLFAMQLLQQYPFFYHLEQKTYSYSNSRHYMCNPSVLRKI
jgi:hypothetical protein